MKFYGTGVVWNADTEKALCRFDKSGELDTTDETVIERLKTLGYKFEDACESCETGTENQRCSECELPIEPKARPAAKSTEKVVKKK